MFGQSDDTITLSPYNTNVNNYSNTYSVPLLHKIVREKDTPLKH